MDKTALTTARDETAARFSDLQVELHRLQGDYRTYQQLIDHLDKDATPEAEVVPKKVEVTDAPNPS